MIAAQRAVHQRVWGAIGLALLVALALSVLVRHREAENVGSLPGAQAAGGGPGGASGVDARGDSKTK